MKVNEKIEGRCFNVKHLLFIILIIHLFSVYGNLFISNIWRFYNIRMKEKRRYLLLRVGW